MDEHVFDPTYGGSWLLPEDTPSATTQTSFDPEGYADLYMQGALDPSAYNIPQMNATDIAAERFAAEQDPFAQMSLGDYFSRGVTGIANLLSSLQGKKDPALPGGKQGTDYLKFVLALLAAKKARDEAKKPNMITYGGGTTQGPAGPMSLGRYMTTGPTGQPIMAYRYAQGGETRPFPMQDGGFVMTGDAVKGAGGPQGIKRLLPEAEMIQGPGTATSDSIPAYIQGKNGRTPALVSNGEAYVPPGRDTRGLYTLMKQLERNA